MVIRPATLADTRGIAEVHVASWRAVYRGLLPDSVIEERSIVEREELWQRVINGQKFQLIVAEEQEKIVGFVNFGPTRDPACVQPTGEILAIYVAPHRWYKGIGGKLMRAALSELKTRGFDQVTLWVLDTNALARTFYESVRFSADGAARNEIVGENTEITEMRYRRQL
jgi:L-amino acid N-acyltransferase YncA